MKRILFIIALIVSTLLASSQIVDPVKWTFSQNKVSGDEFEINFTAKIDKGWHLYSTDLPEGGPIKTSFYFEGLENAELVGKPTPSKEAVEKVKAEA